MSLSISTGILYPTAPYNFEHALHFLGKFRPMTDQQKLEDNRLMKAIVLDRTLAVFAVEAQGTIQQPQLPYTLWSESLLTAEQCARAEREIGFYLGLDDDLLPFYAMAEHDPYFLPIVQKLYGYHQVKFSLSAFENACWAIISQRNQMSISLTMKARLTAEYGESIIVDGKTYRTFPLPSDLANLHFDELNAVIRNTRKTECITSAAHAFAAIDEEWLRSADYEQVQSWLLDIKGIGAWSASFILLRGLGRFERIPFDEKALLESARRVYGRSYLTHLEVQQLGKVYGSYAGYWAHYLRVGG